MRDNNVTGLFHSNRSRYYFQLGRIDLARGHVKKAVDINRAIGHQKGWAINLGSYANTLKHLGYKKEAEILFQKSIALCLDTDISLDGMIAKGKLG